MLQTVMRQIEEQVGILYERHAKFPTILYINTDLLLEMSRQAEFWTLPQTRTQVPSTVRVLNQIKTEIGATLNVVPRDSEVFFSLGW